MRNNPFHSYNQPYNPYNTLIVNHFVRQDQHKFYKVILIAYPYISISDLITLSTLNSSFNNVINDVIWKEPQFKKLAYIHDSLYMFNKFLKYIPHIRKETAKRVKKIDLSRMEENLYDRIHPRFFELLINHCADGLQLLDLSRTDFFNSKSLPKGNMNWTLPNLTYLNLSYCTQVNDDILVKIARGCRQIVQIRLDGLTKHKGQGLACFAAECDKLESVSARYNTAMTDEAITTLAKFRHIRLLELDLTGCTKLTPVGFDTLARYTAHLKYISLAQTNVRLEQLAKFICFYNYTLSLDLSDLKSCKHEQLADWIWTYKFSALLDFTIEMKTAILLVKNSSNRLLNTDHHFNHVKRLVLTNLQEHTPMRYLHDILTIFPNVHYITFIRSYFESDFMLGTYRTPSPESEDSITDHKLHEFNLSQSKLLATVVREREDNLDCSLIHW